MPSPAARKGTRSIRVAASPLVYGLLAMGLVVSLGGVIPFGCATAARARQAAAVTDDCERCENAKLVNAACHRCDRRFVAGRSIPSKDLHQALDAHGHRIQFASLECADCRAAYQSDGFCENCNWGFIGEQLYFSRLTYRLAKGRPMRPQQVDCGECLDRWGSSHWCEQCDRGWVGNVAFSDPEQQEAAARSFDLLGECLADLDRCSLCAVARFNGVTCPTCKQSYPQPSD